MSTPNRPTTGLTPTPRRWRRGNAVLILLLLGVLFGFTALVVDLGTVHLAKTQLQTGVDAAALAGAQSLDNTVTGVVEAPSMAIEIGARNAVLGTPIAVERTRVILGEWDPATRVFTPTTDAARTNAVEVSVTLARVDTPFAGLAFGIPFLQVEARSLAIRPRGPAARLDCYLPVALAECTWEQMTLPGGTPLASYFFADDSNDNIGWAHPTNANAATLMREIAGLLDGTCADGMDPVAIGEPVELNNGVLTSTVNTLGTTLQQSSDPWQIALWGPKPPRDPHSVLPEATYAATGVIQGPIAVFDHAESCDNVRFNQDPPIVAFAWGVIFDTFNGPGSHKGLQLFVDTAHEWDATGGSGWGAGNVITLGPALLVQEGG